MSEELNDAATPKPPKKPSVKTLDDSMKAWYQAQQVKKITVAKSKEKLLKPITSEVWESLDPKAKWDSIVALRGPDLKNSDTLKYFTSSVIRHRLSGVMRVGGMINREFPFVVLPNGGLTDQKDFSTTHFAGHIAEAAHWLHIPVLSVSPSIWSLIMKGLNRAHVVAAIWKETSDPIAKETTEGFMAMHGYEPSHLLSSLEGYDAKG